MQNHDELMAQIEADEREDALATARIMPVREYAKARGLAPQVVYYYLRKNDSEVGLVPDWCECGRLCVNVEEANALFDRLEKKSRAIPLEHDAG